MGFSHWQASVLVLLRTLVGLRIYFCNTGVLTPRGEGGRLLASGGWGAKVWQSSLAAEASPWQKPRMWGSFQGRAAWTLEVAGLGGSQ